MVRFVPEALGHVSGKHGSLFHRRHRLRICWPLARVIAVSLSIASCYASATSQVGLAAPPDISSPVVSASRFTSEVLAAPGPGNSPPPLSVAASTISSALPDAPRPNIDQDGASRDDDFTLSSNLLPASEFAAQAFVQPAATHVELKNCPYVEGDAPGCGVHWRQLAISSSLFLTFMNAGNLYTGYWYRYETMHGKWWDSYVNSVEGWRWNVWNDNNPLLDDYVGHPMQGAITNALWIQNDPKGMTLEQSNSWPYWRSRLRAMAFTTAYSFEWKLGPIGEASIGHNGDHFFSDNHVKTNETGWVELVTTPVGGMVWTLAEDAIDRTVIRRLEDNSHNPFLLLSYQFLNPARATANILRFRPPWYRDSRTVRANSFWSDPEDDVTATTARAMSESGPVGGPGVTRYNAVDHPLDVRPGGQHEFGAWWGLALDTGHVWGAAKDVKYMPIDIRYSYRFLDHEHWALRYSPELTALAMLDEPNFNYSKVGIHQKKFDVRRRTYGSGVSPVGLQADFRPTSRVQPFLSGDGGFVYFVDRVLSPQGSQWMYTIDYGAGINIFRKQRQAVTIGYRYQHLSNANISHHNPGVDENTFYVGVSRFRSKGEH